MEIKGKICSITSVNGVSKTGANWQKDTIVIEMIERNNKLLQITNFNNKVQGLTIGNTYNFALNIESKEFNGKFFTEVSMWKAQLLGNNQQNSNETTGSTFAQMSNNNKNTLPF